MAPFNGIPTPLQQVALAIVPKFTSALSLLGSGYIAFDVLRPKSPSSPGPRKRSSSYHRLLVGMSLCDISMSAGIFLSTWPMPGDVPNVWGNVGTTRTCTAQGFFEQFGVATVMYSASLSIYYLITIRSGRFASRGMIRRIEPWLHVVPVAFGLGTAVAALVLRLFNYGLWDCWIAPMPQGCRESWRNGGRTTCVRGDNASLYIWLFDLIPKWTSILIVTVNMVLVYLHVRKTERASERWSAHKSGSSSAASASFAAASGTGSTPPSERELVASSAATGTRASRTRPEMTGSRATSASRRIAHQSYLYVGALWITWLPVIVLRATQLASGVTYYWMLIWVALSIPMQGFWNALVYLRPRWIQKRRGQREQRLAREDAIDGDNRAAKAANFFRDLSVAAAEAVRQGDVSEEELDEIGRDKIESFELEANANSGNNIFEGGGPDRVSSVTFASQLVSNVDVGGNENGKAENTNNDNSSEGEHFTENQ